jgi:hypothetical protein
MQMAGLSGQAAGDSEREALLLFANQIALAVERVQLREQALRTRLTEEMARHPGGRCLLGLALNAALGWWWADPAAGYVLVF